MAEKQLIDGAHLKTVEGAISVTEVALTQEQKQGLISTCKGPLPGIAQAAPAPAEPAASATQAGAANPAAPVVLPEPVAWLIERSAFRVSPHGQDAESNEWLEEAHEPGEEGSFRVYTEQQVHTLLASLAPPAPAAVAVPEGYALVPIEPTPGMRKAAADGWLDCGSKMILNKAAAAYRAALAATPALPATEDSSAGDLAEGPAGSGGWKVHAERMEKECAHWKTLAETMRAHACKDVWYWQGDGSDNPQSMVNSLAVVIRADDLRDLLAQAQAEVQAEPVALQMCSELKPRSESEKAAYLAGVADGRMYAERDADTAPQAQPADAQDAERIDDLYIALEVCAAELFAQCGDQGRAMKYVEQARKTLAAEQCIRAAMAAAQEGGNASVGKDGAA